MVLLEVTQPLSDAQQEYGEDAVTNKLRIKLFVSCSHSWLGFLDYWRNRRHCCQIRGAYDLYLTLRKPRRQQSHCLGWKCNIHFKLFFINRVYILKGLDLSWRCRAIFMNINQLLELKKSCSKGTEVEEITGIFSEDPYILECTCIFCFFFSLISFLISRVYCYLITTYLICHVYHVCIFLSPDT